MSIRSGEGLAWIGAVLSSGSVGDSCDNALAETLIGYYKAELVHWHNHERLYFLGDIPPAESKETYDIPTNTAKSAGWNQTKRVSIRPSTVKITVRM